MTDDRRLVAPKVIDFEELLAFTVARKALGYLAIVGGFVAVVLVYVGWDLKSEANNLRAEAQAAKAELQQARNEIAGLRELQKTVSEETGRIVGGAEKAFDRQLTAFGNSQHDFVGEQGATFRQLSSTAQSQLGGIMAEWGRLSSTSVASHTELSRLKAEVQQFLTRADEQQNNVNKIVADLSRQIADVTTRVDESRQDTTSRIDAFRRRIDAAGTFVGREKSELVASRFGLRVSLGVVSEKNNVVRQVEIKNADGKVLWERNDVPLRHTLTLEDEHFRYTFTPSYVIEVWPGRDYAIIDASREVK
jgi:hypothetical protein